jgi:hypothetical protein
MAIAGHPRTDPDEPNSGIRLLRDKIEISGACVSEQIDRLVL